jgi:DNA-binding PadR family transcriptional regulator
MAEPFTTYKLIVLYMAEHANETLTNSEFSEFVLDKDYTDYFQIQQVLSELVETELLKKRTISNSSYYEITEEGKSTLSYFENELSSEIKKEIEEFLQSHGVRKRRVILTPADYFTTPQGGYAVRCQLVENDVSIMDLTLSAPSLEAAQAMCKSWPVKAQDMYGMLMEELV